MCARKVNKSQYGFLKWNFNHFRNLYKGMQVYAYNKRYWVLYEIIFIQCARNYLLLITHPVAVS